MKKDIRRWVTVNGCRYKIRSARGPLIIGTTRLGEFEADWPGLETVFGDWFLRDGSEKGWSRKHTEIRVTRWRICFWGNFGFLRWIAKRIFGGEFKLGLFWSFDRWSTWDLWGGGTVVVHFGGILGNSLWCGWGELRIKAVRGGVRGLS
jgi:hypothetical protein